MKDLDKKEFKEAVVMGYDDEGEALIHYISPDGTLLPLHAFLNVLKIAALKHAKAFADVQPEATPIIYDELNDAFGQVLNAFMPDEDVMMNDANYIAYKL
jgi:hypothetical protein